MDLAKAFDTVNHAILLQILPSFGVNKVSFPRFKSYLENRKQFLKIDNVLGQEGVNEYDVPQGSVLGPILFLLYINLISDLKLDGLVVSYADDTCLLFSDKSWEGVHLKATVGLNKVYHCLRDRHLTLYEEKTSFMTFSINKTCLTLNG